MRFGIAIFPTETAPTPAELGRMVEERGLESLFFPDHTHIPAARTTPAPEDEELPDFYSRAYDPFVALSFVAAATEKLTIGSGICLLTQRDPIITAKATASLDRLSGGRYILGVGAGWNREEMENHGTDPRTRFALMRERVEAMREIWSAEEASYHGEHVDFDRIWSWPKPLQVPGPPVFLGGEGKTVIDRVLAYGDGWMPNRPEGAENELLPKLLELKRRAAEIGRDPVPVTMSEASTDPRELETYPELGVVRCVYWLPSAPAGELSPMLDEVAELAAKYRGL